MTFKSYNNDFSFNYYNNCFTLHSTFQAILHLTGQFSAGITYPIIKNDLKLFMSQVQVASCKLLNKVFRKLIISQVFCKLKSESLAQVPLPSAATKQLASLQRLASCQAAHNKWASKLPSRFANQVSCLADPKLLSPQFK